MKKYHRIFREESRVNYSKDISINLSTIILALILTNYGVFGYGLSFNESNFGSASIGLRTSIYNFTLIFCAYFLIKEAQKLEIWIRVKWQVIAITLLFSVISVLSNLNVYQTYLNGDELAYVSNSWFHSVKLIEDLSKVYPQYFSQIQMIDLIRVQIPVLILMLAPLSYIVKKIKKEYFPLVVIIFLLILQQLNANYFNFHFQYLSGYVIPTIISSTVTSGDFAIRVGNAAFFFFLIALGLYKEKAKYLAAMWITPLLAMLFIPAFSNFLPAIDTVCYFVSFGCIIVFRLHQSKSYSVQTTFWIASIAMFFRPANIVWLILVLTYIYTCERKFPKEKSFYFPLLLILPFATDVAMQKSISLYQKFAFVESNQNKHSFFESYWPLFHSLRSAYDKESFALLIFLLLFLITQKSMRRFLTYYLMAILIFYVPFIPLGISGHNKYAFEITFPIFFIALSKLVEISLTSCSKQWIFVGLIPFVLLVSYFVNIQTSDLPGDEKIRTKGQLSNFYAYPLENRLDMMHLRKIVPNHICANAGAIYGDSYFFLTGEKLFQLKERRIHEAKIRNERASSNILDQYNCIIVDSMPNKSLFRDKLMKDSWLRAYLKTGEHFNTTSEIWIKNN